MTEEMSFQDYVKIFKTVKKKFEMIPGHPFYEYWLKYRSPDSEHGLDRLRQEFEMLKKRFTPAHHSETESEHTG